MSRQERPLPEIAYAVLERIGDAVIVLDEHRALHLVNESARRLLGYDLDEPMSGRCRLTTRGIDCENACPLTFAIEENVDRIDRFVTVYRTRDDRAVQLDVTVIPIRDRSGGFRGAIEILKPTEPDPGFFLAGPSPTATKLRRRLAAMAMSSTQVAIVGDRPACRDVAAAVHRFSGAPDHLFQMWEGSWEDVNPWPPGTVFADGEAAGDLLDTPIPDGWRVLIGCRSADCAPPACEIVELPTLHEFADDLPHIIAAWIDALAPGLGVTGAALERLTRYARDRGLQPLEGVLRKTVATANDRIEESDVPVDGYCTAIIDELLRSPNPMAAIEELVLREVLERSDWRIQEAASRLGISRVTLWRKMKDLGIERSEAARRAEY